MWQTTDGPLLELLLSVRFGTMVPGTAVGRTVLARRDAKLLLIED